MPHLIEVKDAYKIYNPGENEVHALDGVSLTVDRGEFLMIVGHSGSGKSTLMNMLGLVCDPVGGLVEYPCQNRNAAGVANATIAAEIALSGVRQLIPFDEMLEAVYTVGKRLPAELRETALGGCATTPSACAACHMCD